MGYTSEYAQKEMNKAVNGGKASSKKAKKTNIADKVQPMDTYNSNSKSSMSKSSKQKTTL